MRRIKISYDIVTHESATIGDFAENGWIDEEGVEIADEDDINWHDGNELQAVIACSLEVIQQNGSVEASSSQYHPGVWYTQIDCEYDEERYSFHLDGFTEGEEIEIYNQLK